MRGVRLAAEIWVAAHMRRVAAEGGAAFLARRGAESGGAVILKLVRTDRRPPQPTARVLTRVSAPDGGPAWSWLVGPEFADDAEVEAKLARQTAFDADLWIVEIEDREGRAFLDEPILTLDTPRR